MMDPVGNDKAPTEEHESPFTRGRKNENFRLFERCSGGVLNLRFDSPILESYYTLCSFPHSIFRFRIALAYFALVCTAWLIFFAAGSVQSWKAYVSGAAVGFVMAIVLLSLTCCKQFFKNNFIYLYIFVTLAFSLLFLLPFVPANVGISAAFNLSLIVQLLLVIYTNIPLRLWQVMLVCGSVSLFHIGLSCFASGYITAHIICIYVVVHCCIHMVGILQHLLSQVRRRSTFMRLGHSALMRKALQKEQKMRNDMIQSLMPQQVAEEVMRGVGRHSGDDASDSESEVSDTRGKKRKKGSNTRNKVDSMYGTRLNTFPNDSGEPRKRKFSFSDEDDEDDEVDPLNNEALNKELEPTDTKGPPDNWSVSTTDNLPLVDQVPARAVRFRKFHVNQMENVSILFADIVGFTKMSSNKSASHLVYLLNDLFGRFDSLCNLTRCEKIATLGDCYYCVSGCPIPVSDHAERIVEMGRSMCVAIQQFDKDHNEQVNMRVGVHTGKVICGLVGTRRFKFDVWSNDVTLANKMESSGEAGKVHLSEATLEFVKDIYEVSEGEPVPDIRKVKVLVEFFNKEQQRYAIKHTQDEALIKTYFVEKRFDEKPVVVLGTVEAVANSDGESAMVETVRIPFVADTKKADSIMVPSANEMALTTSTGAPETEVKFRGSDVEMLNALSDLAKPEEVFRFPPISTLTLCFKSPTLEIAYRQQVLRIPRRSLLLTLATPRLSPVINSVAHLLFFLAIVLICFVCFPKLSSPNPASVIPYLVLILGFLVHAIFLSIVFVDLFAWSCQSLQGPWKHSIFKVYRMLFQWVVRNVFGAVIIACPIAFLLANLEVCSFGIGSQLAVAEYRAIYGLMLTIALFSFTLFPNFCSWTKSLSSTAVAGISIFLLHWSANASNFCEGHLNALSEQLTSNVTSPTWLNAAVSNIFPYEMTVILFLNTVLIWALNREIDISFRVSFNRDYEAACAKREISQEKMQGEWLLENIIPRYVLTDLRQTNKYSQHVKNAGVMFASIANFADFYDEQYQGGQEMLRVLNEIFADFEHQLNMKRFKDVEKIKTIAECFMAASGLNVIQRSANRRPDAHLYALIDFAIELIQILEDFNQQMFNFRFELKIGYNVGEVTAGVIGTTKLLYDIWGDTVNVASRMYSTGQKARIQVTEEVSQRLSSRYDFEYRGNVFVKGKGEMRTHLLVGRKSDAKPLPELLD